MLRELVMKVNPVRVLNGIVDQLGRLDDGLLEVLLVVAVAADGDAAVAEDLDSAENGGETLGMGDGSGGGGEEEEGGEGGGED